MLYQLSYRPTPFPCGVVTAGYVLLRFPMSAMAPAEAAVLVELQPIRRLLLVFLRIVVAAFAFGASQNHHDTRLFLGHCFPSGKIGT
jgi:hypothetical protein